MARTTVLVMIDGLDPEYLASCPAPNLQRFARDGFHVTGGGMMPSVTNVNNTTMVTGHYPAQHGIVSNYWLTAGPGSRSTSSRASSSAPTPYSPNVAGAAAVRC